MNDRPAERPTEWVAVYASPSPVRAEIVRAILEEHDIAAILINKKDSSYNSFGSVEVHIRNSDMVWALKIIEDEVCFE